jgi:hypothetical protein
MNSAILPKESVFHAWVQSLSITEIPVSYQVFGGLSLMGGLLARDAYFDQEKFKVYPNISLLLVGPSGIGKDSMINQMTQVVRGVLGPTTSRILEGKTVELAFEQLAKLEKPAWAYLLAPEITAFLGGRDYQKSMVQDITNLLSNNEILDTSTGGKQRIIYQPTISMLAGSTAEWLHKAMPDGSMEGGFIPRFVVVFEEYASRHVPLIKHDLSRRELMESKRLQDLFIVDLVTAIDRVRARAPLDIVPDGDAKELYRDWYINRFNRYSPNIREYANRCRDQVLRFAMLIALSCKRHYISGEDMTSSIALTDYIANRVELAIRPVTREERIAEAIRQMLPASTLAVSERLAKSFTRDEIHRTLMAMQRTGEVGREHDRAEWRKV